MKTDPLAAKCPDPRADQPIVQLFLDRCIRTPGGVALRHKDYGVWSDITWSEYRDHVERFTLGLLEFGVGAGDRIAVMGDAIPEWIYADMAAQAIGAISYGIYVTTPPADVGFLLTDGGAKVFIAEDQEYVDKILASGGDAAVEHIIVADTRGMFGYDDPRIVTFADVERLGRDRLAREPETFAKLVSQRSAEDVIAIYYTSGTTGKPKGALLTPRNLISAWGGLLEHWPHQGTKRIVTDLALAHYGGRSFAVYFPILFDMVAYIPENQATVREAMVEVKPHFIFGAPRVWETYASQVLVDIESSSLVKRAVWRAATRARRRMLEQVWAGRSPDPIARLLGWLGYVLAFRPMLDKFGFTQLEFVITGGAPVSPDLARLWQLWGVRLREVYGMTEAVIMTVQTKPIPKPGFAGKPVTDVELRLAEDAEILVRGPGVFKGYWNNATGTAETVDAEGWLHTGDLGELLDDGELRIIDRKKDVIVTAAGNMVPASEIEHVLKLSPYVRDAMLVGDGRDYLAALLEIDFETVADWARDHKVPYTSFESLALGEPTRGLLDGELAKANEILRQRGRPEVRTYRALPKELDPEAGDEITATRKVKRRQLADKFADLVEEIYRTELSERIASEIG